LLTSQQHTIGNARLEAIPFLERIDKLTEGLVKLRLHDMEADHYVGKVRVLQELLYGDLGTRDGRRRVSQRRNGELGVGPVTRSFWHRLQSKTEHSTDDDVRNYLDPIGGLLGQECQPERDQDQEQHSEGELPAERHVSVVAKPDEEAGSSGSYGRITPG
jgi:hypothetical protein